MNTAIAQHLNVATEAIIEVQEWARVLWVRVKGLGARFVSKKVTEMVETQLPELQGSEKQVQWANDIRQDLIKTHQEWLSVQQSKLAKIAARGRSTEEKLHAIEQANTKMNTILTSCESASWWIHNRRHTVTDNILFADSCISQMYIAGYTRGQF